MSQRLKKAIVMTAEYYGRNISDEALKLYVYDLKDFDEEACIRAINEWRSESRTFPLAFDIRQKLKPKLLNQLQEASLISSRISGAVVKFGNSNPNEAREYIGPYGWFVIQNRGGWTHICQNLGTKINITTFDAQNRDQIAGLLATLKEVEILELCKTQNQKLSLNDSSHILKKLGLTDDQN